MEYILRLEQYNSLNYPPAGKHIMAQTHGDTIVVYQAYKKTIADFAIHHQKFGGPDFSFNRMSWIKPNFLWMMYRRGWGTKEGQERILAIWIKQSFLDAILEEAVISSFDQSVYKEKDSWKNDLDSKEVRLQWDPDHDPYGAPTEQRALQLGLKGSILKKYATESIVAIQDLTAFSMEQFSHVKNKTLNDLTVPLERIYKPAPSIAKKIGID